MCRKLPPFFEVKGRISWSKIENVDTIGDIENPVVRECLRFLKLEPSLDIHYHGDLPARSGLGSSSAFAVGLLHALHALQNETISKGKLATEAITVEREFIGDMVGVQDQTAVAYGGLNHCLIARDGTVTVNPVMVPQWRIDELEQHVMLFFTGISRNAGDIALTKVQGFNEKMREMRRISALVDEGLAVLRGGDDITEIGRLLHESWLMKRSLSSAVSTDQIDGAYTTARQAGAIGGKLLGAGGGGFLMIFAPPAKHARIAEALAPLLYVPIQFEDHGSQIIFRSSEAQPRARELPRVSLVAG